MSEDKFLSTFRQIKSFSLLYKFNSSPPSSPNLTSCKNFAASMAENEAFSTSPSSETNIPDSSSSYEDSSSYNTADFSPAVMKYINDILLEEDLDEKTCMLQDCLALQAAEKSFYDVLGQNYPPNPDGNSTPESSSGSCNNHWNPNPNPNPNPSQVHSFPFQTCSSEASFPVSDFYREMQPVSLPYSDSFFMKQSWNPAAEEGTYSSVRSRGRKVHELEDYEGRRSKHCLVSNPEESEQLEIFDSSFLIKVGNNESLPCPLYDASRNEASRKLQTGEQSQRPDARMRRFESYGEQVDLCSVLTTCAQAVESGDQRNAILRLKQIRQHSTPYGDGNQRMAHYFADGLEARLTGKQHFGPASGHSATAADILKAYQMYVSICPFRKMTNTLGNRTIARAAEKATRLHIIDFGISYGFQWPCFINRLSTRPGGPPKIRITGIDLPQPGFRPAEMVEETGRRLKRLADTLNVPFEYNAIAKKWETIRYEDLKINRDEFIAVNCMYRLRNLPDDTIVMNSPRDAVLKLIKKINPDIFLHGIINGSFNAPFFLTRFREALFHYSALFDLFEATITREDQERLVFKRELIGSDAINVIACEGLERVERPETYKQWQARNSRIGFRQLPLPQDIVKRARKIRSDYHKDFIVDEDGKWMLLGWKGRIIHAISAWKPLQVSGK